MTQTLTRLDLFKVKARIKAEDSTRPPLGQDLTSSQSTRRREQSASTCGKVFVARLLARPVRSPDCRARLTGLTRPTKDLPLF